MKRINQELLLELFIGTMLLFLFLLNVWLLVQKYHVYLHLEQAGALLAVVIVILAAVVMGVYSVYLQTKKIRYGGNENGNGRN
jgi:high-affinity Fe2+/Pb2+ permease